MFRASRHSSHSCAYYVRIHLVEAVRRARPHLYCHVPAWRMAPPSVESCTGSCAGAILARRRAQHGDGSSPGDDECSVCEPEPTEPSKCERVASAFFEQVAEELAWTDPTSGGSPPLAVLGASYDGGASGLILTPYQLMWVAVGCHFSQARVQVPLGSIRQQRATLLRSPFGNRAEFTFATHAHASGSMIRFPCGSRLAAVEAFAREVAMAMEAIPGGAAATSSTVATAVDATVATAAVPSAPVRRQTKQVLAAADLRAKLKEVVKLQRSHAEGSTAKATAILEGLGGADPTVPSIHTVYKASEHLRGLRIRDIDTRYGHPSTHLTLSTELGGLAHCRLIVLGGMVS